MVNTFGEPTTSGGSSRPPGKRGLPGKAGAPCKDGKRGKPGEDASFYAQCFQHSKTKWYVEVEPNFWIDGYDIQNSPFKVINKYERVYDATVPLSGTKPTKEVI